MPPPLHLDNVGKHYHAGARGHRVALRPLSLEALAGDSIALMGPNGSGKTTLLRIIAGILTPTHGVVRVFGQNPKREASVRSRCAYLGHELGLYDELTAAENLTFYAGLFSIRDPRAVVRAALQMVSLSDRSADRVSSFSRGMKERLAVARLTLHSPDLILLDEPTTGLDGSSLNILSKLIRKWREDGKTVVMSTHDPAFTTETGMKVFAMPSDEVRS